MHTSYHEKWNSPQKKVVEKLRPKMADASQNVNENMLQIVADRQKAYLQNAQRLQRVLSGEINFTESKVSKTESDVGPWAYDASVGKMVKRNSSTATIMRSEQKVVRK